MTFTCNRKIIAGFSYQKKDYIGNGSYSKVYRGFCTKTSTTVAIKVIKKTSVTKSLAWAEINSLQSLKHQTNILQIISSIQTQNHYYLITELCEQGSLAEYLSREKMFSQNKATIFIEQIINGYKSIAAKKIIHRDLKPSNLFLKDNSIKIGDFGFAVDVSLCSKSLRSNVGSPLYMPLQALVRGRYSFKSDIWAIGIVFLEMLTGKNPWKSQRQQDLKQQLQKYQIADIIPKDISQKSKQFLSKALKRNQQDRMSLEELMSFCFHTKDLEIIETPRTRSCLIKKIIYCPQQKSQKLQCTNIKNELSHKILPLVQIAQDKNKIQRMNTNSSSYEADDSRIKQKYFKSYDIQLMKKTLPLNFIHADIKKKSKITKSSSFSQNIQSLNLQLHEQDENNIPNFYSCKKVQYVQILEQNEEKDQELNYNNIYTSIFYQLEAQVYYVKFLLKIFRRFNQKMKINDQKLIPIKYNILYLIRTKIQELKQLKYVKDATQKEKQKFFATKTYYNFIDTLNNLIEEYKSQKQKGQIRPFFQSDKIFLNRVIYAIKLFYQKASNLDFSNIQIISKNNFVYILQDIINLSELFLLERQQNWQTFNIKSHMKKIITTQKAPFNAKYWDHVKIRFSNLCIT